jgi:hypothetical protein
MHTADDTRGRARRRRRGGGQWRGQEAQAPGVPARRPPPCARAGMRATPPSACVSRLRPAVSAARGQRVARVVVRVFYAHDIVQMPAYIPMP